MRNLLARATGVAALLLAFAAAPAAAQNTHSWVSRTGSGSACTRAAPCLLISTALDQTVEGGTVSCADHVVSDTFVIIAKSITIDCDGRMEALPSSFGFYIDADATDTIHLRGL